MESKIIIGSYKDVEGCTERTLLKNSIRCKLCGEIIQSKFTDELVICRCGFVSVDGGLDSPRSIGDEKHIEYLYEFLVKF